VGFGRALKTTTTLSCRPSIAITITPGVCAGPPVGKLTRSCTSLALPSRNNGDEKRMRSSSAARSRAARRSAGPGLSAGFASSGCMKPHLDSLSSRGGSPEPHVDSVADQSIRLNQSPEL
jgi:hypothetical protein